MAKKITTTIEIKTQEMVVIRRTGAATSPPCSECDQSTMFTPEQLSEITGAGQRTIFRLIESGTVHCKETPDGKFWVCLHSFEGHRQDDLLPASRS